MSPSPSALVPPARRAALRRRLLAWYRAHRRDLPWRRTRDPYAVLVAETMLQQTRVAAVVPYFERFLEEFPDLGSLARAPEERVLARWSGLGYYARARRLQSAARVAVERHGGVLPRDPEALAALPGVGRYTLGAVLSIAFDHPWPLLDGNVARVLARLFALPGAAAGAGEGERLWRLAGELVPAAAPGDFNQGLMELGAVVCTPRAPRCTECPLRTLCRARLEGRPEAYPAPRRRPRARRVEATAAVVETARGLWFERRGHGVNRGLLDLPAVEADGDGTPAAMLRRLGERLAASGLRVRAWTPLGRIRHGILDRTYQVTLVRGRAVRPPRAPRGGAFVPAAALEQAPLTARARKAAALLAAAARR